MSDKESVNVATLAEKIMQFSVEFSGVEKTRENLHLKSKYANFDDMWLAAKKPLNDLGLTCIFSITIHGVEEMTILSLSICDGTENFVSEIPLQPEKNTAQAMGSMLTYYKRYLFATMLHITGAMPDDDGAEASAPETLTEHQQGELYAHSAELFGDDNAGKVLANMATNVFNVENAKDIPSANFSQCIKLLDNKAKKEAG